MRQLTWMELDLLKSRYPSDSYKRIKLLLSLSMEFEMNYTKLSKFLISQQLIGYTRNKLYILLGRPIKKSTFRNLMEEVKRKTISEDTVRLLVARNVYKKYCDSWLDMNGHPNIHI